MGAQKNLRTLPLNAPMARAWHKVKVKSKFQQQIYRLFTVEIAVSEHIFD